MKLFVLSVLRFLCFLVAIWQIPTAVLPVLTTLANGMIGEYTEDDWVRVIVKVIVGVLSGLAAFLLGRSIRGLDGKPHEGRDYSAWLRRGRGFTAPILTLLVIVVVSVVFAWKGSKSEGADDSDLSWGDEGWDWKWYLGQPPYQILDGGFSGNGAPVLRRVYADRGVAYYAGFAPEGTLETLAVFIAECAPNTSTDVRSEKGEFARVICKRDDRVLIERRWASNEARVWNDSYGGFEVDEDFTRWNLGPLQRMTTLHYAVPHSADSETKN